MSQTRYEDEEPDFDEQFNYEDDFWMEGYEDDMYEHRNDSKDLDY